MMDRNRPEIRRDCDLFLLFLMLRIFGTDRNRPEIRRDCDVCHSLFHYQTFEAESKQTWNTKGLRPFGITKLIWLNYLIYRNRPEIRRDCDRIEFGQIELYLLIETDLKYEGIATLRRASRTRPAFFDIETDLKYEGIATRVIRVVHSHKSNIVSKQTWNTKGLRLRSLDTLNA